jgi:uncharacterized protein
MDLLKLFLLLSTLPLAASLYEEPWGQDAVLLQPITEPIPCDETLLARAGIKMIRFHQIFISPWDGPRSHYRPSSSQYTLLAMRRYGFFKGFMMGCSRLERENKDPWVYRTTEMGGFTFKEDIP